MLCTKNIIADRKELSRRRVQTHGQQHKKKKKLLIFHENGWSGSTGSVQMFPTGSRIRRLFEVAFLFPEKKPAAKMSTENVFLFFVAARAQHLQKMPHSFGALVAVIATCCSPTAHYFQRSLRAAVNCAKIIRHSDPRMQ